MEHQDYRRRTSSTTLESRRIFPLSPSRLTPKTRTPSLLRPADQTGRPDGGGSGAGTGAASGKLSAASEKVSGRLEGDGKVTEKSGSGS